jgi:hypothetical protein
MGVTVVGAVQYPRAGGCRRSRHRGEDDGPSTEGAAPVAHGGRTGGFRGAGPRQKRAGRPSRSGQGAAGGGQRRGVHRGGPGRRASLRRGGRAPGPPLQWGGAAGGDAGAWRGSTGRVRSDGSGAHSARVPAAPGSGARRDRHLVVGDAAARPAPGPGRPADGQHLDDPPDALGGGVHLAAQPDLVPDRDCHPPAQGRAGDGDRPRRHPQKS